MCLIIHKPAGVTVPQSLIESAWADNSDGAGIMYQSDDGGAAVFKLLPKQDIDPAGKLSTLLAALEDREVGIHFRWRTHGPINHDNTHPYALPEGRGWLMHNGIIAPQTLGPSYKNVADILSDTGFYILSTLQGAPGADDPGFWEIIGKDVGSYNKMLVLDAAGRFLRVNEGQWEDYRGLKLSNLLSCPEYSFNTGNKWWRGHAVDYHDIGARGWEDRAGTDTKAYTPTDILEIPLGAPGSPPRLTRRERKVLNACLRNGNWGPMRRLIGK